MKLPGIIVMHPSLSIDPETGNVLFGDLLINKQLQESALPEYFVRQRPASINSRHKTGIIAVASVLINNVEIEIRLAFSRGKLSSIWILLTPPEHQNLSDEAYWGSAEERRSYHLRWLKNQLGKSITTDNEHPWGHSGVGRDKSDGVFIFMHYQQKPA